MERARRALVFSTVVLAGTVSVLVSTADAKVVTDSSHGVVENSTTTTWSDDHADWPELELNARVVVAVVLSSLGACICAAGGVGGGGLFIPIFNLLLGFSTKTSAALSNIMILGGSLAVLSWNIRQTHPLSNKPLIDYDVALLLNPNMLLGISVGVFCNIMFPGWLLISVLTAILLYMTHRSLNSAFTRWRKESSKRTFANAAAENGTL